MRLNTGRRQKVITMRKRRIDNDVDSIGATLTLYTTIRSARMQEPWMMMTFITQPHII